MCRSLEGALHGQALHPKLSPPLRPFDRLAASSSLAFFLCSHVVEIKQSEHGPKVVFERERPGQKSKVSQWPARFLAFAAFPVHDLYLPLSHRFSRSSSTTPQPSRKSLARQSRPTIPTITTRRRWTSSSTAWSTPTDTHTGRSRKGKLRRRGVVIGVRVVLTGVADNCLLLLLSTLRLTRSEAQKGEKRKGSAADARVEAQRTTQAQRKTAVSQRAMTRCRGCLLLFTAVFRCPAFFVALLCRVDCPFPRLPASWIRRLPSPHPALFQQASFVKSETRSR